MDSSYFMSRLILRPVQSKGGGAPKIHREALQPPRERGPKYKWGNPWATQTQDSHPWVVRILDHHQHTAFAAKQSLANTIAYSGIR